MMIPWYKYLLAVLLLLSIVALTMPRFNRQDLGTIAAYTSDGNPIKMNSDSTQYQLFTTYFRGKRGSGVLAAPYSYRPIVPLLASLLPLPANTAINVINILSLLVSCYVLYLILAFFGFTYRWRIVGCALFVYSFPLFYYGAITYIDPVLICAVTLATHFLLRRQWMALGITLLLGALVKETVFMMIPVTVAYLLINNEKPVRVVYISAFLSMMVVLPLLTVRVISPHIFHTSSHYVWLPSHYWLCTNLHRSRTVLAILLSFGLPGFLALGTLPWLLKPTAVEFRRQYGALLVGMLVSLVVLGYGVSSVFADGRYIWFAVPFTIPLAVRFISDRSPQKAVCKVKTASQVGK